MSGDIRNGAIGAEHSGLVESHPDRGRRNLLKLGGVATALALSGTSALTDLQAAVTQAQARLTPAACASRSSDSPCLRRRRRRFWPTSDDSSTPLPGAALPSGSGESSLTGRSICIEQCTVQCEILGQQHRHPEKPISRWYGRQQRKWQGHGDKGGRRHLLRRSRLLTARTLLAIGSEIDHIGGSCCHISPSRAAAILPGSPLLRRRGTGQTKFCC